MKVSIRTGQNRTGQEILERGTAKQNKRTGFRTAHEATKKQEGQETNGLGTT